MATAEYCRITIQEGAKKSSLLEKLSDFLTTVSGTDYAEIWVDHGDFPCLCALVNGQRAWLMFLRYSGDAGFSSRNPEYTGPSEAVLDFYLRNGQQDEYPVAWTYPISQVFEALKWFAERKEAPSWICWCNDSMDGNTSPNQEFSEI
jgi:hypothetical protein